MQLSNNKTFWTFKVCCIISVLFSKKFCIFYNFILFWMWPSHCVFLTIYFTYNSVNTTIKNITGLFIATCFDSTESSSGYDWNHKCSQRTRAHFGIPKCARVPCKWTNMVPIIAWRWLSRVETCNYKHPSNILLLCWLNYM